MPGPEDANSLEAALDELYGAAPAEFVEVRKRVAGELRAAGDKGAAKELQSARRPTTAAWALNQLRRREPEMVDVLLERSRELQRAQAGSGGREAMRDATRAQRAALAAATDAALAQLGERATDAYRAQVLATLHAASADETVAGQLRAGRLIREVSGPTGFAGGPGLTLVPDLESVAPSEVAAPKGLVRAPAEAEPDRGPKDEAEKTEQHAKQEKADRAEQEARAERRRREREREALEQAQRRLDEAEEAADAAQVEAGAAEAAAAEARERVANLQHDLDAARRDARAADDLAARARREATRLARAATKLRSKP